MTEPIYHLKDAAERCGISPEVVREWIAGGLRCFPLGGGTVLPRDYLIRESWLIAFIEARSVVRKPEGKEARRPAARAAKVARASGTSYLGPCPV